MASDSFAKTPTNSLHHLAAAGGMLLGLFFFAGAFGHLTATWPATDGGTGASGSHDFRLLFPGLLLAMTGTFNIALCRALWSGAVWSLQLSLVVNVVATVYLTHLFTKGVPGHPIGTFLALICSYIVLLTAIRLGLVWPTPER